MKYPIRYFSIGLFTASLILLIGYFFFEPKETMSEEGQLEDLIASIEKEGYRVITESDYISLATAKNELNSLQLEEASEKDDEKEKKSNNESKSSKKKDKKQDKKEDEQKQKSDKKKKDSKKKKSKKKKEVKTYTLVVEENMVISDISQKLEDKKIIKDATKFNKFMEDNEYSPYLQIGEFKLKSDMSHKEIAKIITNR